jgi:hypothetical protein
MSEMQRPLSVRDFCRRRELYNFAALRHKKSVDSRA